MVRPLEVVQEVQEGVAVGVRTGLQQGQQGDEPGVYVLDVYKGEKSPKALISSVHHFKTNLGFKKR